MPQKHLVKAYIVDDDQNATALLCKMLENYSVEIIGTATDANAKTRNDIIEKEPDLLFLDVEMPSMSGLDFCATVRPEVKPDMKVVFYTGYDKYMLQALRQQAFDYMLKPANAQELAQIMTRYYENKLSNIQQIISHNPTAPTPSIMVVNTINEHTVLHLDDIAFFRFDGIRRIWEVVTKDSECHQLRHRTTSEIILAYSPSFVQIHKGYIINIHYISKVLDNQCFLRSPLDHITELRISKNYRHDFMATFYNL